MPSQPRSVPALIMLRDQFDAKYPSRSRVSDGWIGDQAHRQRVSWHNPDKNGLVHARDFTHHPASGMDIDRLTDELTRDNRVLELIANDYYWHHKTPRWVDYNGSNEHKQHFHIAVQPGSCAADDSPWTIPSLTGVVPAPQPSSEPPLLMLGSSGEDVKRLQDALRRGYRSYAGDLLTDGAFGEHTQRAVREFQRRAHLAPDGVIGSATRSALGLAS